MPDVFINPQTTDPGEPGRVGVSGLEDRFDRPPRGLPVDAELACESQHRSVLSAQLRQGPPDGAPGQQGPGRGDRRVLLGQRALGAQGFGATPRAGAPHNHDRRVAEGNIVQDPGTAAVRPRENAAVGTESLARGGLHLHGDRVGGALDGGHVQTRQVDQGITTRAVVGRLTHSRGLLGTASLVAADPAEDPDPSPPRATTTHPKSEEPVLVTRWNSTGSVRCRPCS